METEQQLLNAIQTGERTALRRLYERYLGYAMAVGLRYIPDRTTVEDVVQDSFVKILTSVQQFEFRGEGSLAHWVASIVAHQACDYVRKHEQLVFPDHLPEVPADDEMERIEVPPDVLTGMIARLPAGYRLVLNLFVFEHCSHQEIALRLGIKEHSSTSQLARARKLLQNMLKDYQKRQEI